MAKESEKALVPKLRFPEFRTRPGWESTRLGDASTQVTERVGERKLTPVSISAGVGFVPQAEKFGRDISGNQYSLYTLVRDGDFVYNKGNSLKFPQGCVYQLRGWGEVAAPNVFISFRLKQGYVAEYFQYCFERNMHGVQLKQYITSGARSNGLLNVSKDQFYGIGIPMPLPDEQQKIADCLSSLDELIAAQGRKVEALKAYKRGLMQQLFPREGDTLPRLRFPEFRDAPEWKSEALGKFIDEFREKSKTQDQYEVLTSARSGLVRQRDYYDNDAITERDNVGFNVVPPNYVTYRSRSDDRRFYFNENKLGITGIISTYYPVFRILGGSNKFFVELLSQHAELVGRRSVGTSQTVLSLNELRRIELPTPSATEQQQIANTLASLDSEIVAETKKFDALKAHKTGLMQQLFPSLEEA